MSDNKEKPAEEHPPTYGWSQMENLKKVEEMPKKIPDPYTVPEGYVPPTMKELWQYVRVGFLYLYSLMFSVLLHGSFLIFALSATAWQLGYWSAAVSAGAEEASIWKIWICSRISGRPERVCSSDNQARRKDTQ